MSKTIQYPEHEKLKTVKDKSQCCGEFIDWLGEQGYVVRPLRRQSRQFDLRRMLAQFFEINEDVLEQEKQSMLDELRRCQKGA